MIVLKFGGTSVSTKENIERIKSILETRETDFIVVVSAVAGITNLLDKIAHKAIEHETGKEIQSFVDIHVNLVEALLDYIDQTQVLIEVQKKARELEELSQGIRILNELTPRTNARILSLGEQLSSFILHKYLNSNGVSVDLLESRDLIMAGGNYLDAEVDFGRSYKKIQSAVNGKSYIAGGFIASDDHGDTVNLGRGGSDYSASIYASAIKAEHLEIWSDINGIHSANPTKVKETKSITHLSYEEAFELAYFGAKVLYPPTVLPLKNMAIPVYLKNTNQIDQEGTLINVERSKDRDKIKGLSSLNNIAILTVSGIGLARQKGRARKVFQTLEENDVNVILITQSCSEQSIGIGISQNDVNVAESALRQTFEQEIKNGIINPIKIVPDQCIIALIGDNMRHKVGLSGKVFGAIGENGINVNAIAQGASERNISIVIDQKEESKALNVIHERFFSDSVKKVHLFIAGVGNVGSEFLTIIESQLLKIIDDHNIRLKIVGVANSKRMLINPIEGLNINSISEINQNGIEYQDYQNYLDAICSLNLRNAVFIDNTASELVSNGYAQLLENSISVVTCNKVACSSEYDLYKNLIRKAREFNCHFKYETSVGAALPIIKTIHDLNISGDKISKIEAVISGSLNFIFNGYNGEVLFADIVRKALEGGYTEPNPLIDLSGLDVMRKILILTREAGFKKELDEISFESFIPESCSGAKNNEELFEILKSSESHFKNLYQSARDKGYKLKVVASMNDGKMSVGLQEIPPESPFYNLEGKDNVVAINTNRYVNEPLVIKGAGAGASVTASGVFADLMFTVNR